MFSELIHYYKPPQRTSQLFRSHPEFGQYLIDTTPFLPTGVSSTQRLWHHWNDTFDVPKCGCGTEVNWDIVNQTYRKFCSRSCAPKIQKKRRLLYKPCPVCSTDFRAAQNRRTCSEVCHSAYVERESNVIMSHEETVQQVRQLEPAGVNVSQLSKTHAALYANIMRYTEHIPEWTQIRDRTQCLIDFDSTRFGAKQRREDANRVLMEETGAKDVRSATILVAYDNRTCPKCNTNPRPINLRSRRLSKWCETCATQFKQHKEWVAKQPKQPSAAPHNKNDDKRLNDPDWLRDRHYIDQMTKQQIAELLHVDKETITNRFKLFGIQSLKHKFKTKQQSEVVDFIRSHGITDIIENDKTLCKPKHIDIYIPSLNIAFEYGGLYWHSTAQERITPQFHKKKMDQCASAGVTLITIFSDEWIYNKNVCKAKIARLLGILPSRTTFARKCSAGNVSTAIKREFFNATHIQGDGPSSINYALTHQGEVVACMGFIVTGSEVTLNRFSTEHNVPGGFSKLLKYAIKAHPEWSKIISFADMRWSVGNLYRKNEFVLEKVIPPDYAYTKGGERIHKFNFRHCHLPRILGDKYDPSLSETENTRAAKWFKIYDCGKQRWVLTL